MLGWYLVLPIAPSRMENFFYYPLPSKNLIICFPCPRLTLQVPLVYCMSWHVFAFTQNKGTVFFTRCPFGPVFRSPFLIFPPCAVFRIGLPLTLVSLEVALCLLVFSTQPTLRLVPFAPDSPFRVSRQNPLSNYPHVVPRFVPGLRRTFFIFRFSSMKPSWSHLFF